jgi:sugar/nucleoside kinase (ribokinase family)
MSIQINLSQLAALADCIEGVNMALVNMYRRLLRAGKATTPITVCDRNPQGFYFINDGHHRTLAHSLEGHKQILAEIDENAEVVNISWRWPRISPVSHTLELLESLGFHSKL